MAKFAEAFTLLVPSFLPYNESESLEQNSENQLLMILPSLLKNKIPLAITADDKHPQGPLASSLPSITEIVENNDGNQPKAATSSSSTISPAANSSTF